jgi:hypothetical protein
LPKDLSLNFNCSVLLVAFVVLIVCRWPNFCGCFSIFWQIIATLTVILLNY